MEHNEMKYIDIDDVKIYGRNTKKHPEHQITALANLIQKVGFDDPIILDKNNMIIAGHGRLEAAKKLGIREIPFIKKENLTEDEVKAYRIGHNKVTESPWDEEKLAEELKEMLEKSGIEEVSLLTGNTEQNIINLLNKEKDGFIAEQVDQLGNLTIECPKCGHKFEKKNAKS